MSAPALDDKARQWAEEAEVLCAYARLRGNLPRDAATRLAQLHKQLAQRLNGVAQLAARK